LPVFRGTAEQKGKGIQVVTLEENCHSDEFFDSDYNCAHEVDDNNNSGEDEEAMNYR
jgi:hypothetical protein